MELRQTEDELSSLVEQYKRIDQLTILGKFKLPTWENLASDITNSGSNVREDILQEMKGALNATPQQKQANNGDEDIENAQQNDDVIELHQTLLELRNSQIKLEPKITKFRSRLLMVDPITNAPRYGTKTMSRVESLIKTYETLCMGLDFAFICDNANENDSIITLLESIIKDNQEAKRKSEEEKQKELESELQRKKEKQKELELELKSKEKIEQIQKQREREELSRRAGEARIQRIENERSAIEAEREADRAFLLSTEVGVEGVFKQLQVMKESCSEDDFIVALRALHTIFKQITSRPEEIQFRRIRLDHPQFHEDIGRHCGGKELFVAAGFTLKQIEGKKCLFSAEPDLTIDMDSWSSWFDLIKATFQCLDDEYTKR